MIEGAVKRPVLTAVAFIILVIIGIIGWLNLPISLYPDITLPSLMVVTAYPGASTEDVEEEITKELEDALGNLSGLKEITSESRENLSIISLSFEYGTELDEAANDTRDAMAFAVLPDETEEPRLFKMKTTMMPLIIYTASAENPGIDLRRIVEEKITKELARTPGVGSVPVWGGGREKQVNIDISQTKLEQLELSLNYIVQALKANNLNFPLGDLERGNTKYLLRLPAKFMNLQEIRDVVVGVQDRKPIRLGDIATIEMGFAEKEGYFRMNGKEAVMFPIYKKSGTNSVEVAERVTKKVEHLKKRYPGINLELVMDTSDFIKKVIMNLIRTIGIAILLVLVISFLLLGNIRASIIIAVVIPVSLIVSLIYLYFSGGSFNIISLSAIAIAVGMIVDNAVVVLENIFRHRESGETRREAAIFGAQEVGQAILASTITTVSIFLPLLLTRGFVSFLFKQLAITIPIMLIISLLSAMTLSPMLASRFLKTEEKTFSKGWFRRLEKSYSGLLEWALNNKGKLVSIFIGVFLFGVFLFSFIPIEFFPESDSRQLKAEIELPPGASMDRTNEVVKKVEKLILDEVPEIKNLSVTIGGSGSLFGGTQGSHTAQIFATIGETKRTTASIAEGLEKKTKEIPGIKKVDFSVTGGPGGEEHAFGAADIEVEILGDDLNATDSIARLLQERLKVISGISGIEISRKKGARELWLVPQSEQMYSYGLSAYSVGSQLRTAFFGTEVGKLNVEGKEYPIMVRLDDKTRNSFATLDNLMVTNLQGDRVYISNFLNQIIRRGPTSIERKGGERVIKLEISTHGRALGDISKDVRRNLRSVKIPSDIHIEYGGTIEQQEESFKSLIFAIIIGIILVFLVMAAQFESFLDPFIIMFSVPFAFVGVSLGFFVSFQSMAIMGMIGIAMLMGIVVNNAIVMVDYINILRRRGMELREAVMVGATRRLRPILMTTGTTVFGLLPLAIGRGMGAEMWRSLGISVVGGMAVSSLITLLFVPTMYAILEGKIKRRIKE